MFQIVTGQNMSLSPHRSFPRFLHVFWSEWEKKTRGNQGLASEIKREHFDLEATNGCVKRLCERRFLQGEWGQLSVLSLSTPNVQLMTQQPSFPRIGPVTAESQ